MPIRFFVPGPDNEIGERDDRKGRDNNQANGTNNGREAQSERSAAGVYERYVDSIVDSGEILLPSRFMAFPEAHLDSLENPSYATEFKTAEGRVFLLPALGGTRDSEEGRALFGFGDPRPVDYSLSPQASFFKPFPKYRSVIGGSMAYSRNGIQSFTLDENIGLPSPPFPPATMGSRATVGTATNSFFTASLVAARRFGGPASAVFGSATGLRAQA